MARDEIVRELAETAAARLAEVVDAAERQAAAIEAEARSEAERIVSAAREEAREQVERAQEAVNRLVEQAEELRSAFGRLGSETAEVTPQPPVVPEPTPPREPEPAPPQTPEPMPPPTPEPTPPQTPEPQPPGPQIAAGRPSTEDLLAQLKSDAAESGTSAAEAPPAPKRGNGAAAEDSNGDVAAARLVAMKMALDGASRDEIAAHLEDSFSLSSADQLLDDVLARAKT